MPRVRVARVSSFADGEVRRISVGATPILLARVDGDFYAVGARCPHQGAPLEEGILCRRRIVCPWHHSVFDLTSGETLDPPTLDSLRRFRVIIEGDDLIVDAPAHGEADRPPEMTTLDEREDVRTFIIVGAGAAGVAAAQELRRVGYQGKILLVGQEHRLPYDRTHCSKGLLTGEVTAEQMPLRSEEFYVAHGIRRVVRRVVQVELRQRTVLLDDGTALQADRLLLAPGGEPRRPDLPGAGLDRVFTLRSWRDAEHLALAAAGARRLVLAGGGFIGMEVAASLRTRGVESVTVVSAEAVPLAHALGDRIGGMLRLLHEEQGVSFRVGTRVVALRGKQVVESVELETGEVLPADLVVLALGIRPATDFVAGAHRRDDGALITDPYLRVVEGVYAAGDAAAFPDWRSGERIRIEHWRLAEQHGQVAAHNMVGRSEPFERVPMFWTYQFGISVVMVGHASSWDEVIYDGEVEKRAFIAYFVREGRLLAAAGAGRDREMAALHELLLLGREPQVDELRSGTLDLEERLRRG